MSYNQTWDIRKNVGSKSMAKASRHPEWFTPTDEYSDIRHFIIFYLTFYFTYIPAFDLALCVWYIYIYSETSYLIHISLHSVWLLIWHHSWHLHPGWNKSWYLVWHLILQCIWHKVLSGMLSDVLLHLISFLIFFWHISRYSIWHHLAFDLA